METRHLGKSGLRVPPLCLGTMNFSDGTEEAEAFRILDVALELGIYFMDTADIYGRPWGVGTTEELLGRWFAQGGGRRERTVLATKAYGDMQRPGVPDPNRATGLSGRRVIQACEESLRRLGTEWIDLHQMHHIDRSCPPEELLDAYETLIRQGKVRYVGSSNFAGWDIATYRQVAAQRKGPPLVAEQSIYNLNNRMVELEVLPACAHYGVGVIPWSPLDGGFLAGRSRGDSHRRKAPHIQERLEQQREKMEGFEKLCGEVGESPAVVAVAWLLHNPVVTAPIIGARTVGQLREMARAAEVRLDAGALQRLDELFPGPGGAAPKAYAW